MRLLALLLATAILTTTLPPPTLGTSLPFGPDRVVVLAREALMGSSDILNTISRFNQRAGANTTVADFHPIPDPRTEQYAAWTEAPTGPDVVPVIREAIYASGPGFLPTDDVLASTGLDTDMLPAAAAMILDAAGVPRAVPVGMDGSVCVYSKPFFASHSLVPPTSYSEMLALCAKLNALGSSCFGPATLTTSATVYFDNLMLRMYGGPFYESFFSGNVSLTDDARIGEVLSVFSSLAEFSTLVDKPSGLPFFLFGEEPPRLADAADLGDGTVGFFCEVSIAASIVLSTSTGAALSPTDVGAFRFPVFDLPRREGSDPDSPLSVPDAANNLEYWAELGAVSSYAVPANALRPDAGKEYLAFIGSLQEQTTAASNSAIFPVRRSLNDSVSFPTEWQRLTFQILGDAPSLHVRSNALSGFATVSTLWDTLIADMLLANSSQHANDIVSSRLPQIEATRLAFLTSRATPPVFSPPAGTYNEPITLVISPGATNPSDVVFYTLDGSIPTTSSSVATQDGISLSADGSTVVRAFTLAAGLEPSAIVRAEYVINLPPVPPVVGNTADDNGTLVLVLAIVLPLVIVGACIAGGIGYYMYSKKDVTYTLSSNSELVIRDKDLLMGAEIGRGSFGSVYSALWHATPVAVKQMHSSASALMTRSQLVEFVSEAEVLMKLRHPNVLIFLGIRLEPPAIVTELMQRGSLHSVLLDPEIFIDPSMLFSWAYTMASGLHFLEHSGCVHGDFKSLNVLLDMNWTAKICDFGLTVTHGPSVPNSSSSSSPPALPSRSSSSKVGPAPLSMIDLEAGQAGEANVGTLFWSAPELLSGTASTPSAASDAYALGITLWELAARRELYQGSNPLAVAVDVMGGLRPNIESVSKQTAPLLPVMQSLWAADPSDRLTLAAACTQLSSLFSPSALVFPTTVADPSGRVTVARMSLLHHAVNLGGPGVESEVGLILAFAETVSSLASDASGLVLDSAFGSATVMFHTPFAAATFANSLIALASGPGVGAEWVRRVACVMAEGDIAVDPAAAASGKRKLVGPVMDAVNTVWDVVVPPQGLPGDGGVFASSYFGAQLAGFVSTLDVASLPSGVSDVVSIVYATPSPDASPSSPSSSSTTSVSCLPSPPRTAPTAASPVDVGTLGLDPVRRAVYEAGSARFATVVPASVMETLVSEGAEEVVLGSYARVYPATLDGRPVVAKVLLKQDQTLEGLAVVAVSLQRSAVAASAAGAGGCAPIAMCLEPPYVGFVVERMENGSVKDILEAAFDGGVGPGGKDGVPPCTMQNALSVARSMVDSLCAVHRETGIGHGALKPSSLFLHQPLGPGGPLAVKIVGFALNPIKSNQGTMTVVPSVAYLSPDALRGSDSAPEGDVFVVGTLLFELMTGTRAFYGSNAVETALKILSGWRPSIPASIPPSVASLIADCWREEGTSRPTMAHVGAVLTSS